MGEGPSPEASLSRLGDRGGGWSSGGDTGTLGWEGSSNVTMERKGSSGAGAWLSVGENGAGSLGQSTLLTPSVETDDWGSVSPGQGPSSGGHNLWGRCEVIDEDPNGGASGGIPSLSSEAKGKRENGMHSKENPTSSLSWGDTRNISPGNVVGTNWKSSGSSAESVRNDDCQPSQQHFCGTDLSVGTNSSQGEDILPPTISSSASRASSKQEVGVEWEELDRVSVSSSERETFGSNGNSGTSGQAQETLRPHTSSPGSFSHHHPDTLIGSSHAGGEGQLSGSSNFSAKSNDIHMNSSSSDDSESFGYSRIISPRNGAGTPVQGRLGGSATPTQSRGGGIKNDGGTVGGETSGGNCWRAGRLNIAGMSSVGNGGGMSNWKGDLGKGGGGYQNRLSNARKPTR